jgi:hypothetical protein
MSSPLYFYSLVLGGNSLLLLGELNGALSLLFLVELNKALLVVRSGFLHLNGLSDLGVLNMALSLESQRSNQSLNLWGLLGLTSLSSDNEFSDIVLLGKIEELSDLVGSLWSKSAWLDLVRESSNLLGALLDDDQVHNREIRTNNATTDGLSLAGTLSSGSEALHVLVEQKSDTSVSQNTLHHGETLLVITTTNANDVAGPFLTERVSWDLSCDS